MATGSNGGRVVVLGNGKGGTGKSTVSMHLVMELLRDGLKVGSLDLDVDQGSLSAYVRNRRDMSSKLPGGLPLPDHTLFQTSRSEADDVKRVVATIEGMIGRYDTVVIDTPGSLHYLSAAAHSYADLLITPLNDSFIDLDVLVSVDPETLEFRSLGRYAETVIHARRRRLRRDGQPIHWLVLRNRLSSLDSRNKRRMSDVLDRVGPALGCTTIPGLSERVIFRELFLRGLTLHDLGEGDLAIPMTASHRAARAELGALMAAIGEGWARQLAGVSQQPGWQAAAAAAPEPVRRDGPPRGSLAELLLRFK